MAANEIETLRFLTPRTARRVAAAHGTPSYVYDLRTLEANARAALAFPAAFGVTVRYAMKAAPNAALLCALDGLGLGFDASSAHEVRRAIRAGVAPWAISLSTQQLEPAPLQRFLAAGVQVNACSLAQLRAVCEACRSGAVPAAYCVVGLRFNPGVGSGSSAKTNVGGRASSFGIWHELLEEAAQIAAAAHVAIVRVHTHIGSGSDPQVWQRVSELSLALCERLPSVNTLNLGGGFKVGRMASVESTDLQRVGAPVKAAFEQFAAKSGRELRLEIEVLVCCAVCVHLCCC